MNEHLMTPDEFGAALDRLMEASRTLVLLPLGDMAQYVERVETLAEDPDMAEMWTDERRETTTFAGRLIAAATHVAITARLGGAE